MTNPILLGSKICGTATADGGGENLSSVKKPVGKKRIRVVYARVPPRIFDHVHAQAALSGMSFNKYMTRFLEEAFPYTDVDEPEGNEGNQG